MIPPDDLRSPELTEGWRRSVAMLQPGAPALNREDALAVLDRLVELLREQRPLMPGDLMTSAEVSAETGVPKRTLDQWRYLGEGPPYVKLGRHVRYRRGDVDRWLDESTITPNNAA